MKQLIPVLLLALTAGSCQKNSLVSPTVLVKSPTASFKLAGSVSDNMVMEATAFSLVNLSTHATSYTWSFDGDVLNDKTPADRYYKHCGEKHTITLTAVNEKGQTSKVFLDISVLCSGKHPHH